MAICAPRGGIHRLGLGADPCPAAASKSSTQIPLLGDIPGLGAAFSNKDNSVQKTELIILITPRVVRDTAESRQVTEEYRRKIKAYMSAPATRERTPATTALRLSGQ